jgi:hypothetical protein
MINSPGTTIGIFFAEGNAKLISLAELLAMIKLGKARFTTEEYFCEWNGKETELVKFKFDPYTGATIVWDELYKRAVNERMVADCVEKVPEHPLAEPPMKIQCPECDTVFKEYGLNGEVSTVCPECGIGINIMNVPPRGKTVFTTKFTKQE